MVRFGSRPQRRRDARRSELDSTADPRSNILYECSRRLRATIPEPVRDDELGIGINRRPGPHAASARFNLVNREISVLPVHEGPDFIAFGLGAREDCECRHCDTQRQHGPVLERCFAIPVMRQVALMEVPSSAEIACTWREVLERFMETAQLER